MEQVSVPICVICGHSFEVMPVQQRAMGITRHAFAGVGSVKDVMRSSFPHFVMMMLALVAGTSGVSRALAAVQKIVPSPPLTLPADAQKRVLAQLVDAEPALKTLMDRFPKTTVKLMPTSVKQRYAASASVTVAGYLVNMRVTAAFSEDLSTATDVRRESFTAHRVADIKNLTPGQVLAPVRLAFEELNAFCDDPAATLAKAADASRGSEPQP